MNTYLVRGALCAIVLAVVGYPLSVWYSSASLSADASLALALYPAFGLLAFSFMYLHIIGRPFATKLERHLSFAKFERLSSYLVFVSIILHPLLRTIYLLSAGLPLVPPPAYVLPITLGFLGFLMLITYDLGKAFIKSEFVTRHWSKIDLVSTLGFYVIFVHALMLGSDLHGGVLRIVWIGYGATAAVASAYVFIIKRTTS